MDTELLQRLFAGLLLPALIIIEAFQIIYFFRQCKDVKGIRELLTNRVNADAMTASRFCFYSLLFLNTSRSTLQIAA